MCSLLCAQKRIDQFTIIDFSNEKKFKKYLRTQNVCGKLNFVEMNADDFVSLNSKYKNTDRLLEDISEKTGYEINIMIAKGKYFTSQEERKQKLLEDLTYVKLKQKCQLNTLEKNNFR